MKEFDERRDVWLMVEVGGGGRGCVDKIFLCPNVLHQFCASFEEFVLCFA